MEQQIAAVVISCANHAGVLYSLFTLSEVLSILWDSATEEWAIYLLGVYYGDSPLGGRHPSRNRDSSVPKHGRGQLLFLRSCPSCGLAAHYISAHATVPTACSATLVSPRPKSDLMTGRRERRVKSIIGSCTSRYGAYTHMAAPV